MQAKEVAAAHPEALVAANLPLVAVEVQLTMLVVAAEAATLALVICSHPAAAAVAEADAAL